VTARVCALSRVARICAYTCMVWGEGIGRAVLLYRGSTVFRGSVEPITRVYSTCILPGIAMERGGYTVLSRYPLVQYLYTGTHIWQYAWPMCTPHTGLHKHCNMMIISDIT